MAQLYEQIKNAIEFGTTEKVDIPEYILSNLKYPFFDWQAEALQYFLLNENRVNRDSRSNHLMFNMATGTGKTLLMASMILYYYKQGYRHFIFFVNANNIVDKTENNFINQYHNKYLFTEKIIIDNKTAGIKQVEKFSENPQGIEIKFTTIQKLYNDIHVEREDQTTLEELNSKNIIMLADEAHHLNTDTKRKRGENMVLDFSDELKINASTRDIEKKGWEHTVIDLILNKNGYVGENKNVLLEFTATIPTIESVARKYEDKIIYKFGLKEFLQAGYTKEINLISSSLNKKERILQALLFQWYRHKIALKYGISNFKAVVLFRSKTIEDSKKDYEEFLNLVDNLNTNDFNFIKNISSKVFDGKNRELFDRAKSRTEQVLSYIEEYNIKLAEIADWVNYSFKKHNVIITNSKTNKSKTEKTDQSTESLLNSLEDKNNHIRAIFTVNRLTEGWDVLNLFDIVRLYEGRDEGTDKSGTRKAGSATIAEKQLIGRGVRYYPFDYENYIRNKRKFDGELNHELRVLEELYFYSTSDHRYIDELKRELKKDGYISENKVIKTFSLKEDFIATGFYKQTKIWYNKVIDNPDRQQKDLNYLIDNFSAKSFEIGGFEINEQQVDFKNDDDKERLKVRRGKTQTIIVPLSMIERHIFLKAVNIKAKEPNSLYQFENLNRELKVDSIDDLYNTKLANFELKVTVSKEVGFDDLTNKNKLDLVIRFLTELEIELKQDISPKIGSDFITGSFEEFFREPKVKSVRVNEDSKYLEKELVDEDWYIVNSFNGTSEEVELIDFLKQTIGNLENKYQDVYLLRNEEVFTIYDFNKGRGFQPDFILFLKQDDKSNLYYQIFIEPKGSQFLGKDGKFNSGKDGWKADFLEQISNKYGRENLLEAENKKYYLIGFPFYNKDFVNDFAEEYRKLID